MSELILIVEDEQKLASVLTDYLSLSQYQSHCLYDGADVIDWVKTNKPSAILLDLMLPVKDGMQLCREIRAFSDVPILMMTAKVEEIDRLLGLEMGADDYICKPYSPREVVARVKAVLRRTRSNPLETNFKLDLDKYQVHYAGKCLDLTAVEFQLLKPLSGEPGRIFTREQLMQNMYADNRVVSDRTIDSHIKKLRKKLLALSEDQEFIQSVYGVGYRFCLA